MYFENRSHALSNIYEKCVVVTFNPAVGLFASDVKFKIITKKAPHLYV